MRQRIDTQMLVCEFIRQTGKASRTMLRYQRLPFERIVEAIDLVRDPSRHPIYQVLFDVQSFGHNFRDSDAPLSLAGKAWDFSTVAKHDLSIFIDDSHACLEVFLNYATSLFREDTIASFAETYSELLRQFAALAHDTSARWHLRLSHLRYLSAERYRAIVEEAHVPTLESESRATICSRFEEEAVARGDCVAIVAGEIQLTYGELNHRANRLAHHLRGAFGVVEGARVLLCLDRSDEMIIAILAVLKAGGAYVPVEPSHPDRRIKFIQEDSGARVVLTQETCVARMERLFGHVGSAADRDPPPGHVRVLAVDAPVLVGLLALEPNGNPVTLTTCESAAYVIYTSGSTGTPKGVLETHKNVVRLFEATNVVCEISKSDVWPLFHSYGFDFSVWEVWGALLHGGRLVVPSHDDIRDPQRFYALCTEPGLPS